MDKYKIGIIGATGYTGSELVRLLVNHPNIEIKIITSESRAGDKFSDVHPQMRGIMDMPLRSIQDIGREELDLVFLALPHGVSMDFVKEHFQSPFKIVDLSGDFRLKDKSTYDTWYKKDHNFEEGIAAAAFGLPELYKAAIAEAKLVANPGCFPTTSILSLAPLLDAGVIDERSIVVDAKTGVTGAGIKAKPNTHFPMVNDNFTAYGVKTHRHTIEIQDTLSDVGRTDCSVLFTPHLLPVDRGILATSYSKPSTSINENQLKEIFEDFYKPEPFVRVLDTLPSIKQVRGSNYCDVYATYDERTNTIISMGAIDNLVKGASGQAIQNMNIMLGLDESTGLNFAPLQP